MDNKKKVIMVNGKKRAGKDYFSDVLCQRFDFTKVALAKKLKDAACGIAGISFEEMEDLKNNSGVFKITYHDYINNVKDQLWKSFNELYTGEVQEGIYDKFCTMIKECNYDIIVHSINKDNICTFDARIFLQEMGGIWKVVFSDDQIWAKLCLAAVAASDKNVIISDFRYPYELDMVAEHYSSVTSVKVIGKNMYDTDQYDQHSSETALNNYKFQYHINNTFWHTPSMDEQVIGLMREING